MTLRVISGNHAQSEAVRLARVQVVSAYPITPQTTIVERLADHVADGSLAAQYVKVESEHSALQVAVSAAALGARTYTATSSQGLLLMHELLHWAAGVRAPIVMGVVNRAVAPPWNIGADHTDSVVQQGTGWIQFYPESNQEVLDTVLMAYRVAEDPAVRLPAMVCEDAFYLSHTVEPVDVPEPSVVDGFLPARVGRAILRVGGPNRLGSFTGPDRYAEFRHELALATERVPTVLARVEREYGAVTGRSYGGPLPGYRTEDADAVLLTMGTASTTARSVVDELRSEGRKVGTARLRMFQPFPEAELRALGRSVPRIGVVDRSFTFGPRGAAAVAVRSALYGGPNPPEVDGYFAGIGGRDITPTMLRHLFGQLLRTEPATGAWEDLRGEEVSSDG